MILSLLFCLLTFILNYLSLGFDQNFTENEKSKIQAASSFMFKDTFQSFLMNKESPCQANCNNHGQCMPDKTCKCDKDYIGGTCSTYCPNMCSGRGQCAIGIGCLCEPRYRGKFINYTELCTL
jgi:hypothetical protein